MSLTSKKISFQEFAKALKTVKAYFKQLETTINEVSIAEEKTINLQGVITNSMLKALVQYYKNEYDIELRPSDLKYMDVNLLAAIDYNKMENYRGLGAVGILKFKEILQSHGII
jgi:hypothetical protein